MDARKVRFEAATVELERLDRALTDINRENLDARLGRGLLEHEIEYAHGRLTREDRDIRDSKLIEAYIDACKKLAGGEMPENVTI